MRLVTCGLLVALVAVPAWATDYAGGDLQAVSFFDLGRPQTLGTPAVGLDYSNVTNFLGLASVHGGAENQAGNIITRLLADDITPASGGTGVTQMKFSVANLNDVAVSARARVRFWFADGAGGGPGTYYNVPAAVGFTFNAISFSPGVTVLTATLDPNTFTLPNGTFWAGVTFDNNGGATGATLDQMNNLGQGLFNPPTVGSSADVAFLTNAAGSFFATNNPAGSLFTLPADPNMPNLATNYGWEFTTIPEPTTLAGLMLAGLGLLLRRR
jgi:hypothetical protein